MNYKEIKPASCLAPFIHSYWQLKGAELDNQWERNFPDGCPGLVMNLGDTCMTDNGSVAMAFGKTYMVGAMTSYKDSFIHSDTHLVGVCLKPAAFANFYNYVSMSELTDQTIEFERVNAFNLDKTLANPIDYFNQFFADRMQCRSSLMQAVTEDIHANNGALRIDELSQRNFIAVR